MLGFFMRMFGFKREDKEFTRIKEGVVSAFQITEKDLLPPPNDPQWGLTGWDEPANRVSPHNRPYAADIPVVTPPEIISEHLPRCQYYDCGCCLLHCYCQKGTSK